MTAGGVRYRAASGSGIYIYGFRGVKNENKRKKRTERLQFRNVDRLLEYSDH